MAITADILRKILSLLGSSANEKMWSAMTLAHFGCMRTAEFVAVSDHSFDLESQLCERDISFFKSETGENGMRVYLKRSKTDPTGKGLAVYIGCTGTRVCAVSAMHTYLALSTADCRNEPLFRWDDRLYLTRAAFVNCTKDFINALGLDSREYSGHSYRAGGATFAGCSWLFPARDKITWEVEQ